jgi:hypothetical protein
MKGNHTVLMASLLISVLLLVVFLYLQGRQSRLLSLEGKWLALAGVPLVLGLLVGGYIHKFKGFGIELETLLKDPLGGVDLLAKDAMESGSGDEKDSLAHLDSLSDRERADIQRLSFVSERQNYYSSSVIARYLERLPRLEYIEVKAADGAFVCLLRAAALMEKGQPDRGRIDRFTRSLEQGRVQVKFAEDVIVDPVKVNDSLVDILPKVRASRAGALPVLSDKGRLVGVVTTQAVEKRIADDVVAVRKRM